MNDLSGFIRFNSADSIKDNNFEESKPSEDREDSANRVEPAADRAATSRQAQRGVFCGFEADQVPLVRIGRGDPQRAISAIPLHEQERGKAVLVLFEHRGDERPIIVGLFASKDDPDPPMPTKPSLNAKLDGESLVLHAERQIELRCGEASITLTRAGKVLIRGAYVLSRSKGANKIKGAYVDIN